jgi:hypothetical protein
MRHPSIYIPWVVPSCSTTQTGIALSIVGVTGKPETGTGPLGNFPVADNAPGMCRVRTCSAFVFFPGRYPAYEGERTETDSYFASAAGCGGLCSS